MLNVVHERLKMKYKYVMKFVFFLTILLLSQNVNAKVTEDKMDRITLATQKYEELFAGKRTLSPTDPELMNILQDFIFGEVFYIGNLDDKTRELITVVSLATMQTLPQLKAHINAALNVGNKPIEVREAIYQCAPFIGFPKTLNAVSVFNEVMSERGIKLPLDDMATITEGNRYAKGAEIQKSIYGDEVKQAMQSLPKEYKDTVPDILTTFCFGDFYTRGGLDIKQRELLSLVSLVALGAEKQLEAHIVGNLRVGNDKELLLAAMVQTIPYVGLPQALTAINMIKEADVESYKPIYEK